MVAAQARVLDQCLQQAGADTLVAKRRRHRHAPEMPAWQQARGTDGEFTDPRHRMLGHQVPLIELQRQRHALLHHKHRMPQCGGSHALPGPVTDDDAYCVCGGHVSNAVMMARQVSGTGTPLRAATSA